MKRTLILSISYLPEWQTGRKMGLKINSPTTFPVYLFGVCYLPLDNDIEACNQYISKSWDIWILYHKDGGAIMLGNFNAQYAELPICYTQKKLHGF